VFENRVLKRIFRPKKDEIIGGWEQYHDDEVENDAMGRACRTHGREGQRIQDFGGETRRKETTRKTQI
jgi:hypothetical protein